MGLKDLLNKGKCLVGLHQGEWRSVLPTECTFVRVCELCHIESRRVDHVWPEWSYTAGDVCDQSRLCSRCSSTETRVVHAWASPDYVSDDSCEQQRLCTRCRASTPSEARHVMDGWRFATADGCDQVQTCSRCHADGARRRVEHTWADWQHSNAHNGPVRVCRRCGELQAQAVPAPPAAAGAAGAASSSPSRTEMFQALKGKMQTLAEHTEAFERVLGSLADDVTERLSKADATPAATSRPSPPTFSDDEVADLLERADVKAERHAPPGRDARLIGLWEYEDIIPGGGLTTQLTLHLAEDGSFTRSVTSWGPAGQTPPSRERGRWHDDHGSLVLEYDDGRTTERRYEFQQGGLFFPGSQWTRTWTRVR